jgi:hypothetical protein
MPFPIWLLPILNVPKVAGNTSQFSDIQKNLHIRLRENEIEKSNRTQDASQWDKDASTIFSDIAAIQKEIRKTKKHQTFGSPVTPPGSIYFDIGLWVKNYYHTERTPNYFFVANREIESIVDSLRGI